MNRHFAILNPCAKRWEELPGEGRKRFCPECQTYVHSLAQYTPQEIVALKKAQGRVCGYSGGEALSLPRSRRAILAGALLSMVSPLMAKSGRVRFRVSDQSGALFPYAEISFLEEGVRPPRTLRTDQTGEVIFTDLAVGDSRFTISAPGWATIWVTVTVRSMKEVKVWATLHLPVTGTTIELPPRKRRGWWIY